jgi:hypothetical protein
VPDRPGTRLRTLEDVFAYAQAEGVKMRIDGTDVQVRRPAAGRPGRKTFISGKRKQNTTKTTTFTDGQGRTLFSGVPRPGRMHDQTALRTEGIVECFREFPDVQAEVDEGYRGLANESRPGHRTTQGDDREGAGVCATGRAVDLARSPAPPVLEADLCGARQRRVQAVAAHAALHQPP